MPPKAQAKQPTKPVLPPEPSTSGSEDEDEQITTMTSGSDIQISLDDAASLDDGATTPEEEDGTLDGQAGSSQSPTISFGTPPWAPEEWSPPSAYMREVKRSLEEEDIMSDGTVVPKKSKKS